MNLRHIAENYRSFPRTASDEWVVSDILTAIFKDIVAVEFETNVAELLDRDRIAVHSMFEFLYDVSRVCELHVLAVDDKLVGFASRFGKGDWNGVVLDHAHRAVVAIDLLTAAIQRSAAKAPPVNLTATLSLDKHPMKFLDPQETMFVLQSPRSVCRLNEVPRRHRTFFVDQAGRAYPVTSIGDFQGSGWVDGKPVRNNMVSVLVNGEERLADATQLLFELIPGQANLDAVLPAFNQPDSWMTVQEASVVNRVKVSVTTPGRWDKRDAWVQFYSDADREKFMAIFPVGQVNPGMFNAPVIGALGEIYTPE